MGAVASEHFSLLRVKLRILRLSFTNLPRCSFYENTRGIFVFLIILL